MVKLRKSKPGFIVAGVFLIYSLISFLSHIISVFINPADTGLSALWFFLATAPWGYVLPDSLLYSRIWGLIAYPVLWAIVLFNAFLFYCAFGGIRIKKSKPRLIFKMLDFCMIVVVGPLTS